VHDAAFVCRIERLGYLHGDAKGVVDCQRSTREARREVLAWHQLHEQRHGVATNDMDQGI